MPICTRCGSRNVEVARFCTSCGAPVSAVAIPNPLVSANPTCKICDRGTLMRRKIRRLSGPAVAIGYILLIPSILGMAACAILLIVSLLAGVAGAAHGSAFATAFAGIGAIAFVYIGILSFVFGLVGWLLIMKKHILQCVYCGAVVDAAAAVYSHPNRSFGRARVFGISFLFLIFIAMAVGLFHNDYRTWASGGRSLFDWTEFAARWHIHTATGPAQSIPDNSTAVPAQPDAGQPFTFADGRFSVLFPGTPTQSSQPVQLKNGETATLYVFSVTAENGNTGYAVKYINYPADYVNGYPADYAISDPQVRLQAAEKGDAAGKTLFKDQAIDLDGVPGRDYAIMLPDGSSCTVHEYLAGNRLYQLIAWTAKDYLPNDQGYQFLHSFRIWGNPPTAVNNSTAQSETPEPAPALSFQPSPESTDITPAPVASQQETSGSPSTLQTTEVTQGQTPDQVVAILGPPVSITTGPTPVYNYPHLVIVFARGKVWKIHQFQ